VEKIRGLEAPIMETVPVDGLSQMHNALVIADNCAHGELPNVSSPDMSWRSSNLGINMEVNEFTKWKQWTKGTGASFP